MKCTIFWVPILEIVFQLIFNAQSILPRGVKISTHSSTCYSLPSISGSNSTTFENYSCPKVSMVYLLSKTQVQMLSNKEPTIYNIWQQNCKRFSFQPCNPKITIVQEHLQSPIQQIHNPLTVENSNQHNQGRAINRILHPID